MLDGMTNIKAREVLKELKDYTEDLPHYSPDEVAEALEMAMKALESKPMEKFDDVKTHIQRLAGDYKCWDNRLTWEEALELNRIFEAQPTGADCISRAYIEPIVEELENICINGDEHILSLLSNIKNAPPVTPQIEPCEDCISREAVDKLSRDLVHVTRDKADFLCNFWEGLNALPSVKPKYTDEEIDKAQAVEQAYVDKMVELAVEEIKERYSDAIGKMKKAIDEMTEIHSDGEFYIKNVDAKWIISKYLCGAEMSGGGEDEESKEAD